MATQKDYFKRLRAQGKTAKTAWALAAEWLASGRAAYHIKSPCNIEYNPQSKSGARWIENVSNGLRFTGFCDEINTRIDHKGWFCDDHQGEVMRGAVYQLPARKGKTLYVAAYADPYNDDCALVSFETYAEKEDAARAANYMAEKAAEESREHNEAYYAGQSYAENLDTSKEARAAFLALRKDMKGKTASAPICTALQKQLREYFAQWRNGKKAALVLLNNWQVQWRAEYFDSFNDGAGEKILN